MSADELLTSDEQSAGTSETNRSFFIGLVAGIEFAIDLKETRGVSPVGKIIRIPGTSESIIGLTYFRGGIEAVVDLAVVWGKGKVTGGKKSRAVLVEAEGRRAVFMVEDLKDLFSCENGRISEETGATGLAGQTGSILRNGLSVPLISSGILLQSIS